MLALRVGVSCAGASDWLISVYRDKLDRRNVECTHFRSAAAMTNQPDMTTAKSNASNQARIAGRMAQFLLGIPLGLFQLVAVLMFTFNGAVVTPRDWFVAVWGIIMSTSCALLALRIFRSASARRVAFALLGAQGLFSSVKFLVYHESAGLVFALIVALTLAVLVVYHRGVSA
jgi:hypothetical protein